MRSRLRAERCCRTQRQACAVELIRVRRSQRVSRNERVHRMSAVLEAFAEPLVREELRTQPTDPALFPIADKVLNGERVTGSDCLTLFQSYDLLGIGALADWSNRQKNGDRVFVCANQHLNPTNVCILRAT